MDSIDSGIVRCFSNRIKAYSPQTQGSERYGNPTRHSEGATKPPDGLDSLEQFVQSSTIRDGPLVSTIMLFGGRGRTVGLRRGEVVSVPNRPVRVGKDGRPRRPSFVKTAGR